MRYSAEQQQTRERLVRAAARRFRRRRSQASISKLMRNLHLTHGGFYRHFESKEDLFAEAFEQSLKELGHRFTNAIEQAARGGELKALIDAYLHVYLGQRGGGCPSPRLGRVDGYSRIDDSANGLVGAIKITVIRLTVALTVAPSEAPVSALFAAASINPVVGGPRCNDRDQRRREQSRHNVPSPPRRRPSEGG